MYPQQFVQGAVVACALLLAVESLVKSGHQTNLVVAYEDHSEMSTQRVSEQQNVTTGSPKTLTKCLLQLSECYNTNNCQQAWLIMKTLDVASKMSHYTIRKRAIQMLSFKKDY